MSDGLARIHVGEVVPDDVRVYVNFDDWIDAGERLAEVDKRHLWDLGDWWIAGQVYGARADAAARRMFGLGFGRLANIGSVARKFETSRRREVLPFKHHEEAASLPPDEADRVLQLAEECQWSSRELRSYIKGTPHVAQNSGNNEWYTPPDIIEAARAVLGGIDLDPASSPIANEIVGADHFFTEADDGLSQEWPIGRIWMNPPYAQPAIAEFTERYASEIERGSTGIVLVNNATETKWFQRLEAVSSAICFPLGRVRFLDPDGNPGGAPLQGQAILYAGTDLDEFARLFGHYGFVVPE